MTSPTSGIIEAADAVVDAAREIHKDIPEKILFVLDSGKGRRGYSMIHGHFAKNAWHDGYHEIKLGTESLSRGPVPTLGTILHELSHAIAFQRGIKDTSNNGRYHNGKFREIATDMGIQVEQAGSIGWSSTTVPEDTENAYSPQIKMLGYAITTYREGYSEATVVKPKTSKPGTKMVCGCNQPTPVSKKWFETVGQYATCGICHEGFELDG